MCGICGVRLLGKDISDDVKYQIARFLNTLEDSEGNFAGVDGNALVENNALAAGLVYLLNVKLNHRGRISSGISAYDGIKNHFYGGMGVARKVFSSLDALLGLPGIVAIGHDRYATTGEARLPNIQPFVVSYTLPDGTKIFISLGHNGNATNEKTGLRDLIIEEEKRLPHLGLSIKSTTDSELLLHSVAIEYFKALEHFENPKEHVAYVIKNAMQPVRGAFSIVGTIDDILVGYKDPRAIRPLVFGQIGDDMAVFASEKHAILDLALGGGYEQKDIETREVENAELIVVDSKGASEYRYTSPKRKFYCSFEDPYLKSHKEEIARMLRYALGQKSYEKRRVDLRQGINYFTVPVLKSGTFYGIGFSDASKILYEELINISENYTRSFMEPTKRLQQKGAGEKYEYRKSYEGIGIFLTDDSIVRSYTMTHIVRELRNRGVEELHVMVGTPPIINPCWLGVQIPNTDNLIAADLTRKQVERYFESIFYGVEYEADKLESLVAKGWSVQSIVTQSILDGENRYLNNLDMTQVIKGKFSLTYPTLKDFKETFDKVGINSKELCTACFQRNLSGYPYDMRRDLQVAGVT